MSLKVMVHEEPRVFGVFVGERNIGKVISYKEADENIEDDDMYFAELDLGDTSDPETKALGWHKTLKAAALKVVEYHHGPAKISKVTERPV